MSDQGGKSLCPWRSAAPMWGQPGKPLPRWYEPVLVALSFRGTRQLLVSGMGPRKASAPPSAALQALP